MKIGPNILRTFRAAVLGAIFALISAASGRAQILLTVDITKPDAVVFTATGNGPSTSVGSYTFYDGIDLVNFFTANVTTDDFFPATPTTLTTGDGSSGTLFDSGASTESAGEGDDVDLSLFTNNEGAPTMSFTTGQPALTGALTLNLSGQPLPSVGTSNALLAGYYAVSGTTPIGSYVVVEAPEPSTGTMIAVGFLTLAVARSRRIRA